MIRHASTLTLALVSAATLPACQDPALFPLPAAVAPLPDPASVLLDFCTDPAVDQKIVQKLLIILDHSGSNAKNYLMAADGSGAPALVNGSIVISPTYATDPTGQLRYGNAATPGTLINYLVNLPPNDPANPQFYFALVDFNGTATSYPAGNSGFTSDIAAFAAHVQSEIPPNDSGSTSYASALGAAQSIITADLQAARAAPTPVASYYTIVFMSDGSPITSISGVGTDSNGNIVVTGPITITKEPSSQILGEVGTIMALGADPRYVAGMNLFTVYYYVPGNVDTSGQQLLSDMAQAGYGLAYDALSGTNVDYRSFLPSVKHIKYTLADVVVTNSSVNIGADGKAVPDTDRANAGQGIGDLALRALGGTFNPSVCASLGAPPYPVSDPGGLNDCEKLALGDAAGIDNPDSNGDGIPDGLELKNGIAFQSGTSPAVTSPGLDGMTVYDKIKFSLPVATPLYEILDPEPSQYLLSQTSTSPSQDCYHLEVANLPVAGDGNEVRVDVTLQSELMKNTRLWRVGTRSFAPGARSVSLRDWNDPVDGSAWKEWP
jgi:hypothetical protein